MIEPSRSCPPSHALTLLTISRLAAAARWAILLGEQVQHRVAKVVGVHEDIKGDDQHRQEAEDAAEHSHDGTENRPDRLTALANRRGYDRLADADVLLQQSPFDEELLRAVQHLRRGLDKRALPCS